MERIASRAKRKLLYPFFFFHILQHVTPEVSKLASMVPKNLKNTKFIDLFFDLLEDFSLHRIHYPFTKNYFNLFLIILHKYRGYYVTKNLEVVPGDSSWHSLLDLSSFSSEETEEKKKRKEKEKEKKKNRGEKMNGRKVEEDREGVKNSRARFKEEKKYVARPYCGG